MPSYPDPDCAIVLDRVGTWRTPLRQTLAECALAVLMAAAGEEAIGLAHSTIARLVFLHEPASYAAALDISTRIRLIPSYVSVPIILLGAQHHSNMREAAAQVGVTLLLSPPISFTGLKQAILPLLGAAPPDAPLSQEWKRPPEPRPAYWEAPELTQAPKLLAIYRGGSSLHTSRRTNWYR